MDETKQPGLSIGQIFLSRVHFEHHPDFLSMPPDSGAGKDQAQVKVQARIALNEDESSGAIAITLTSDSEDALYRYEIEMMGLVSRDPDTNMPVRDFLLNSGPTVLYPFLREAVANITLRGRFGPIWLKPFNWKAVQSEAAGASAEAQTQAKG